VRSRFLAGALLAFVPTLSAAQTAEQPPKPDTPFKIAETVEVTATRGAAEADKTPVSSTARISRGNGALKLYSGIVEVSIRLKSDR
jgi:hypothetical protein